MDIVCLLIMVAFFGLCLAFAKACCINQLTK